MRSLRGEEVFFLELTLTRKGDVVFFTLLLSSKLTKEFSVYNRSAFKEENTKIKIFLLKLESSTGKNVETRVSKYYLRRDQFFQCWK